MAKIAKKLSVRRKRRRKKRKLKRPKNRKSPRNQKSARIPPARKRMKIWKLSSVSKLYNP